MSKLIYVVVLGQHGHRTYRLVPPRISPSHFAQSPSDQTITKVLFHKGVGVGHFFEEVMERIMFHAKLKSDVISIKVLFHKGVGVGHFFEEVMERIMFHTKQKSDIISITFRCYYIAQRSLSRGNVSENNSPNQHNRVKQAKRQEKDSSLFTNFSEVKIQNKES
ncbi:hypothetical protein P5673_023835 [Acropora cervicornis]|uniref:Uncharacterized protein n=1 Tax=Acropora cervicornis TaxID=6130 RepID=A0AAD9Q599_ACRCE|nr:hypothetical protein P5673_023835 [Acropora cervicornis]